VRVDHSLEGALSLTAKGRAMVAGARPFPLVAQLLAVPRAARPTPQRPAALSPSAIARLRILARWRAEMATQRGLPLPVVFHDAALVAIAARAPRSAFALRWLPGVGPQRARLYGDAVVRLLATIPDVAPAKGRPRRGSSTSSAG